MSLIEREEEEQRYVEAADEGVRTFDSRALRDEVRTLRAKPVIEVGPDALVADVAARMAGERNGCVLVVDGGRIAGIFTERDLLARVVGAGLDPKRVRVRDVMTRDPERLTLQDTVGYAFHQMSVRDYRHIPLMDGDRAVGVISQREIVRYLAGFFPQDIINQPPRSLEQRPPRNQYGG